MDGDAGELLLGFGNTVDEDDPDELVVAAVVGDVVTCRFVVDLSLEETLLEPTVF